MQRPRLTDIGPVDVSSLGLDDFKLTGNQPLW